MIWSEKKTVTVEKAVKKEKKAEAISAKLSEQLDGVSDLNQLATANNINVGEATQVKFANTYVSGIGLEPYIVGASMYLPVDQISNPMTGESGVFVLSINNRTEPEVVASETAAIKSRLKYTLESRSNFEAYNALLDAAKVEDNRLDVFYN